MRRSLLGAVVVLTATLAAVGMPSADALEPFERQLVMPLDRDVVTFLSLLGHPTSVP
jgi:hypothetical protein